LVLLAFSMARVLAPSLVAAALVGIGSAVFHPESSRVARMASGGQHGMGASLFQGWRKCGARALGPSLAALALPRGQSSIGLVFAGGSDGHGVAHKHWHVDEPARRSYQLKSLPNDLARLGSVESVHPHQALSKGKIAFCLAILVALMFSKFFYLASLISYYTFYLMSRFHLSLNNAPAPSLIVSWCRRRWNFYRRSGGR